MVLTMDSRRKRMSQLNQPGGARPARWRTWLGLELVEVSTAEKLVASLGGGVAMLLLMAVSWWALPGPSATAVVASMGASAVLLPDCPSSPVTFRPR
jgi:CBS-domain-containing membrane protein